MPRSGILAGLDPTGPSRAPPDTWPFWRKGPAVQEPERKHPAPGRQCTPIHPQPAQPLPWAGALPVGGRTWCVHTLVAATGIKAHLAGPTLDAVLLTLVDVWVGEVGKEMGNEKVVRMDGPGAGTTEGMGVGAKQERNAFRGPARRAARLPLNPATLI